MAVEEEARRRAPGVGWDWGQVEHRRAVEPGEMPTVVSLAGPGPTVCVWLLGSAGDTATSAVVGTTGGSAQR